MMNDTELKGVLDLIHTDLRRSPAPSSLLGGVRTIPFTTAQQRGWLRRFDTGGPTMFSALKSIAASVIVALFSGFLLTVALTTPQGDEVLPAAVTASATPEAPSTPSAAPEAASTPSAPAVPSVRTDILPGASLTVVAVEPGVMRVLDDGVRTFERDGDWNNDFRPMRRALITGLDGTVWLPEAKGLVKLGDDGRVPYPTGADDCWEGYCNVGVAADGSLWLATSDGLYRYDGQKWRLPLEARERGDWHDIEFQLLPDGSVWVLLHTDLPGNLRFRRFDGTGWTKMPRPPSPAGKPDGAMGPWVVSDDGTAWGLRFGEVIHFDGERWSTVASAPRSPDDFAVTPEGTARFLYDEATLYDVGLDGQTTGPTAPPLPERLAWFDSYEFDYVIDESNSIRSTAADYYESSIGESRLAPDGSPWRSFMSTGCRWGALGFGCGEPYLTACDGVATLNDDRWAHHLPGRCVGPIEFGSDGTTWLWAAETTTGPVITPTDDADPSLAGAEMPTLELGPFELYVITPEAGAATK